jgi:hypothetical protein
MPPPRPYTIAGLIMTLRIPRFGPLAPVRKTFMSHDLQFRPKAIRFLALWTRSAAYDLSD